eukprot:TRINITY_DN19431_c0_g1_i1.p2 TRINITY_DN19431_c0_g1~~TRINITY_DN19431_c0_g1_i1.p2  ORF type:complete len:201 (+),score=62.63 TRINITY_DN19431_c0_g1_i1:120-722(+)
MPGRSSPAFSPYTSATRLHSLASDKCDRLQQQRAMLAMEEEMYLRQHSVHTCAKPNNKVWQRLHKNVARGYKKPASESSDDDDLRAEIERLMEEELREAAAEAAEKLRRAQQEEAAVKEVATPEPEKPPGKGAKGEGKDGGKVKGAPGGGAARGTMVGGGKAKGGGGAARGTMVGGAGGKGKGGGGTARGTMVGGAGKGK